MTSIRPERLLSAATALARATLRPERVDRLPRAILAAAPWGLSIAGIFAASVARYPRATMLIDDRGPLPALQLWAETDAVARALRARGIGPGDAVGILARNSRQFVQAMLGAAKVGADVVYLNPSFSGPQLAEASMRERLALLVHEAEFDDAAAACRGIPTIAEDALAAITAARSLLPVMPTRHAGRQVILTSGTTGRPRGAQRSTTASAASLAGLLDVPFRARDTVLVAAPMFHAWGLAHLSISLATSSTTIVRRRFDPESTLAAIEQHRARGLVVVPVMLQRLLALEPSVLDRYDTSSLRYIASSGSALGAPLVTAALGRFGPVLYNVYGSTEVALASVATPEDLRVAPTTAGRVAFGSTVRIFGADDSEVPVGRTGRVFVGNGAAFDGYTGGGTKESMGGLLASGDVGHFDESGRLFIDGRDDDMIVSGSENVFPTEVEDLLAAHPAIADVVVVGVPDDEFGEVLKAYVVRKPGARLTKVQVRGHVRANLAGYKVPRHVSFVKLLPRTETGKVRKLDLRP